MSWLSDWLRKTKLASIEKAAQGILKILVPILAPALKASVEKFWEKTKDEVDYAESTGQAADEKFDLVFKGLKDAFGEISRTLLSVAIELAVSLLKARLKI